MRLQRQSNGRTFDLGSQSALAAGGEARIYALPADANLLAKIYHQPSDERTRKLAAMLANPPTDPMASQGHCSIAWPVDLLTTAGGSRQVVGFLMPRVTAMRPIIDFYHPKTRRAQCPLFSYKYLHRTARNLATAIGALHARGYVVGDVNESNILVSETALVTLVDTDSFQVPDLAQGLVYRCPVGKPEFTPPELQGKYFAHVDRAAEHDLFGLAVLIFQLLMEGTHPFAGVFQGGGDAPLPEQRISAGHFPYSRGRRAPYRPMPLALPFDVLAPNLQQLFVQCFEDGHRTPGQRPDARTWQNELTAAENALVACRRNPQHWYGTHTPDCPWCLRTARLGGRDPFPRPSAAGGPPQRPLPPASRQPARTTQAPPGRRPWPTRLPRPILWALGPLLLLALLGYWFSDRDQMPNPSPPGVAAQTPAADPGASPPAATEPTPTPEPPVVKPAPRPTLSPPASGFRVVRNSLGMEFVLIPAGEFEMGARDGEANSSDDERPRHRVKLSNEICVSRCEVAQGDFQTVMGFNPSHFCAQGDGKNDVAGLDTTYFPVENVTWFDCVGFANRLSERESPPRQPYYRIANEQRSGNQITDATVEIAGGNGYRLLTEAEWEYVARAGTSTVFPWGDSLSSDQANFDGNSPYGGAAQGKDLERTTTVASYAPNPWGLYDTAGNVWEWVWDWYDSGYYGQLGSTTAVDPAGPSQRASLRVLRGGGWGNVGRDCRPAFRRFRDVPGYRNRYFGFRLALGRS